MKALKVLLTVTMLLTIELMALPQQLTDDTQAQQRVREGLMMLHSEAKSLADTSYPIDPRLNRVLERALSDSLRSRLQANQPETLRELLREEMIYDYQVHLLSIPVESLSAKAIGRVLGAHATLPVLINNKYVNQQGITVEREDEGYIIHLLLTEHYIDITEIKGAGSFKSGDIIENTIYVLGISFKEKAFYRIKGEVIELEWKEEAVSDETRQFKIVIPEQFTSGIEFLDSTGRTIAVY